LEFLRGPFITEWTNLNEWQHLWSQAINVVKYFKLLNCNYLGYCHVLGVFNAVKYHAMINETNACGHKTFKYKFCADTLKLSNQSKVFIWYSGLIGWCFEYQYKLIFKCFMTAIKNSNWLYCYGNIFQICRAYFYS
jgi:hypothetical protein